MKKLLFLLLGTFLIFTACKKDETVPQNESGAEFQYDGANQSAPFLENGTHVAAARFPASLTGAHKGKNLDYIEFFLLNRPTRCEVVVYDAGSDNQAGKVLYSADITSGVAAPSWNRYILTAPVEITGEDLWIGIKVFHNDRIASVGCDPGPAVNNGDWIFSDSDNEWKTLRERTNRGVNINWNIRGFVER